MLAPDPSAIKVVILAGGRGTRLAEETDVRPKPMVEVGGYPLLWHVMKIYAAAGVREFIIALGYKGEYIKEYFSRIHVLQTDFSIRLRTGQIDFRNQRREPPDWLVHLVDTGFDTPTGGRIRRLRDFLDGETFGLTYGDGVADIDVRALLTFHRAHGKLVTVTGVRPQARFGSLELDGDRVRRFTEKPTVEMAPIGAERRQRGWVNGGFFVVEPRALEYIAADDVSWEAGPLERLAAEGELMVYRHTGFWQPVDTLRDKQRLQELWERGDAPWVRREPAEPCAVTS
jgi:glucose-1-phosphate cytidylyltransferase